MADKKYENFLKFQQLYPEYKYIFVGDNGQGDVLAAQKMLTSHPQIISVCASVKMTGEIRFCRIFFINFSREFSFTKLNQ
jgi:hypothetical protein